MTICLCQFQYFNYLLTKKESLSTPHYPVFISHYCLPNADINKKHVDNFFFEKVFLQTLSIDKNKILILLL